MAVFTPGFAAGDCTILDDTVAYEGFFRIRRLRLAHALFAGGQSPAVSRELFERDNAVGVLLFDPVRGCVVLVEQFRVGAVHDPQSPWLLELVAGVIDPGESEEAVARRETAEEAGLAVTALWRIGRYYTSPGGSSEQFTLYCGRVDAGGAGGLHGLAGEHEDIRVHCLPFSAVPALIDDGSVRNVHTLVALQWLLLQHARLRAAWCA